MTAIAGSVDRFAFLLVVGRDRALDATRRLSSEPVFAGLLELGESCSRVQVDEESSLAVEPATCLFFHYDDRQAVEFLRRQTFDRSTALVVCFTSDVYDYGEYVRLHDFVDFFLAPTELHRKVLACQLSKPVYVVREAVDPIASDHSGPRHDWAPSASVSGQRRLVWFGYAESFSKGMSSVMPVIASAVRENLVESFSMIVNVDGFKRLFGDQFDVALTPYDDETFGTVAKGFEYSVLSHFPLDLHINSFIKSSNKAVTSLFAGLIPLCSNTPDYAALLETYGLQQFLFSSPSELRRLLKRLDPVADAESILSSGIVASLRAERAPARLAAVFLSALERYRTIDSRDPCASFTPQMMIEELPPPPPAPPPPPPIGQRVRGAVRQLLNR